MKFITKLRLKLGEAWGRVVTSYNDLYGEAPLTRGAIFQALGIRKGRDFLSEV